MFRVQTLVGWVGTGYCLVGWVLHRFNITLVWVRVEIYGFVLGVG